MKYILAICALTAVLAVPVSSSGQATDGQVSEELFERLIGPVEAALAETGARGVAMRAPAANNKNLTALMEPIQDRIGNFLFQRGYEVKTVAARGALPEDLPFFDFEVDAAGFDYPSQRSGFLGLGREKWLRRAALGIRGRIEDPRDGRWLWQGEPRLVIEDWIASSDVETLAEDRPLWMAEKPLIRPTGRSPWWERSIMAGLLVGVVILYTDGTQ